MFAFKLSLFVTQEINVITIKQSSLIEKKQKKCSFYEEKIWQD
jgi:hypothetical protein